MTTVYQHQEAIRAILTQEPRERNDAIDRLLGLSDFKNLLSGISDADQRKWQKEVFRKFAAFETRVKTVLVDRERYLEQQRQEAVAAGIARNKITARAVRGQAGAVLQALDAFAAETSIAVASPEVPD